MGDVAWRTIASAPTDGRKVLLFALRDGLPVIEVDWYRQPEDGAGYIGWGRFNPHYWPPTHWLPLPEAPDGQA